MGKYEDDLVEYERRVRYPDIHQTVDALIEAVLTGNKAALQLVKDLRDAIDLQKPKGK